MTQAGHPMPASTPPALANAVALGQQAGARDRPSLNAAIDELFTYCRGTRERLELLLGAIKNADRAETAERPETADRRGPSQNVGMVERVMLSMQALQNANGLLDAVAVELGLTI